MEGYLFQGISSCFAPDNHNVGVEVEKRHLKISFREHFVLYYIVML